MRAALLCFPVRGVLAAARAILFSLQPPAMLLLVLSGGIVPFLAIFALERDDVLRHRVLLVSFFVLALGGSGF